MTSSNDDDAIDWRLTTWEGSRRETMRRWAELPLERIVAALEEMASLTQASPPPAKTSLERPDEG